MKMRGRKIAYWVCVLLLVGPVDMLIHRAEALEQSQPGTLLGHIAAAGVCLFIGAYIALYKLLPMFGRKGRWHMGWPKAAVGVLLVALGLVARWYFSHGSLKVTEAANLWIVMGGYLLATAIEKPPAPDAAQADGEQRGA